MMRLSLMQLIQRLDAAVDRPTRTADDERATLTRCGGNHRQSSYKPARCLALRSALVERLYASLPDSAIVLASRGAMQDAAATVEC
jgi:hypothetical protein